MQFNYCHDSFFNLYAYTKFFPISFNMCLISKTCTKLSKSSQSFIQISSAFTKHTEVTLFILACKNSKNPESYFQRLLFFNYFSPTCKMHSW